MDQVAVVDQDPCGDKRRSGARQRLLQGTASDRLLQWRQPGEGGQRVVPTLEGPDRRDRAVPGQGLVGLLAEEFDDGIDPVVVAGERLRQLPAVSLAQHRTSGVF
jgi:hypothetical protein